MSGFSKKALSREEVLNLPPAIDLVTAANVLGISRSVAYKLAQSGDFPTTIHKLGGSYRVPTQPLLDYLGITRDA